LLPWRSGAATNDGWFFYKGRPTSLPWRGGVATHGEASLLQTKALLSEGCGGATGANNIDAWVDGAVKLLHRRRRVRFLRRRRCCNSSPVAPSAGFSSDARNKFSGSAVSGALRRRPWRDFPATPATSSLAAPSVGLSGGALGEVFRRRPRQVLRWRSRWGSREEQGRGREALRGNAMCESSGRMAQLDRGCLFSFSFLLVR
jgi:hypothetical protein